MSEYTRRAFLQVIAKAAALGQAFQLSITRLDASPISLPFPNPASSSMGRNRLFDGWENISRTYRPHTRWWWPGNAVTKDGIRWELDQMHQQGMGGVEIMSPWRMYAEGNIDYLSPQFLDMLDYAVEQAEQRDMEVAISFCPGWKFGGFWVPPTQRSKVLAQGWKDVKGPAVYKGQLPAYKSPTGRTYGLDPNFVADAPDENLLLAVIAAKVNGTQLDPDSLVDLTRHVQGNTLQWEVPQGAWRIMAFRLKYTGEICATTENLPRRQWVVDHFSANAVGNYCDYLGGSLFQKMGPEFGRTVDTLFSDSFEVMVFMDTIHWSNNALDSFKAYKGYDLHPYLPAIWWNIGPLTPKIRYDVNDFLGWLGINAFFKPFIEWGKGHNIDARIQPYYRFTEELIHGAGISPRPEMEVTTPSFTVITDPRKAVSAGAHLYGREIVSTEAYTFLHPERYRSTLEEMKIATDAFLRDGVTQFYNHGYIYSPEMHVAPSRDVPWANRISHWNTWWKYYGHLTKYISRCCYLLRQGDFVGDVLLYSPQATVWTQTVLFNNRRRVMPYGNVGQVLVANGYDFDPVNDDILQNHAEVSNGEIRVRDLKYRFLILPAATAVPVATMRFIRNFVLKGGVVVALDKLPSESVGVADHEENDAIVKKITEELFGSDGGGKNHPGGGRTYFISEYKIPDFDATERLFIPTKHAKVPEYRVSETNDKIADGGYAAAAKATAPEEELVRVLMSHLPPDFGLAGKQMSNGLTFIHRRIGDDELYFVTNISPEHVKTEISFRVVNKVPEIWDPMTGTSSSVVVYNEGSDGIRIPVDLFPYASTFYLFRKGSQGMHMTESTLEEVRELTAGQVKGVANQNGSVRVAIVDGDQKKSGTASVSGLPEPYRIEGPWEMSLEEYKFEKVERQVKELTTWTDSADTKHFSGTGHYSVAFRIPSGFVKEDTECWLNLGVVGNVAAVKLNGSNVGVAWMRPYILDITGLLEEGVNHLQIAVTNTLINYVAGLDKLPGVPEDLVPHYGPTSNIYKIGTGVWESKEKGFHPLPPSGLLGPVMIFPRRKVTIELKES